MGMSDYWEATGLARETYSPLSKEIKRILEDRIEFLDEGKPVPKIVTFSLYMTSWKTTSARPTIIFCCEWPLPRWRAHDLIKENGILDKHPSWALGDSSFPPEFDQALIRLALEDHKHSIAIPDDNIECVVLYRPSDKTHGIEVFLKGYSGKADLRRATVSGIVRAEDRYYGLTIAHAFHETSLSSELMDDVGFQFDLEDSEEEIDLGQEVMVEEISRGS
jgi:hypothetical protein